MSEKLHYGMHLVKFLMKIHKPQTMAAEREVKFQAPGSPFKNFWLRLRLHSPGWNQLFLEMTNIVSTNAIALALFVRFFCANWIAPVFHQHRNTFKLK